MAAFKILDVRKIPSAAPDRIGKLDHLVTYQLDPFRTYMVTVQEDTLTDEKLKAAVKKDLESMDHFIGKEFQT